ncbi:MAG: hypothetical protein GKR89_11825 [Candidatus Latescibacteria bacterium]|nr:hypothetical protein [Candidatus Latescibacterota bacterium]
MTFISFGFAVRKGACLIRSVMVGLLVGLLASLAFGQNGDFDQSGRLDWVDFFLFVDHFGQSVDASSRRFDLDTSGRIGLNDFFLFAHLFGQADVIPLQPGLTVFVEDEHGQRVEGANLVRYRFNTGVKVDEIPTDSEGRVHYPGITQGRYTFEVYHQGVFWAFAFQEVSSDPTRLVIPRTEPHFDNHRVTGLDSPLNSGGITPIDQSLAFAMEIAHDLDSPQEVAIRLIVDRDHDRPYDFEQVMASQALSAGESRPFTFSYTPHLEGDQVWRLEVLKNGSVKTDSTPWMKVFVEADQAAQLEVAILDEQSQPVSGGIVERFTFNFTPIDNRTTEADRGGYWGDIEPNTYYLEIYVDTEFWASQVFSVIAGYNRLRMRRNDMRISHWRATQGVRNVTESIAQTGSPVEAEIFIAKTIEERRDIKLNLAALPDYPTEPLDASFRSSLGAAQTDISFKYSFTPDLPCHTYFLQLETDALLNNIFSKVDDVPWQPLFKTDGCAETAMPEELFFDDFQYRNTNQLEDAGWTVRTASGAPGHSEATFRLDRIQLLDNEGASSPRDRILRLEGSTDGTHSGTQQAGIETGTLFLEGTYAARIYYRDQPLAGSGEDGIVNAFFARNLLQFDGDPAYSELDFEYLPNNIWTQDEGPQLYIASWDTYFGFQSLFEEDSRNRVVTTRVPGSLEGWHTLVIQVFNDLILYYVDGNLKVVHSTEYYPESRMRLSLQIWFHATLGVDLLNTSDREYGMDVDWIFHAKDVVLTTEQVELLVNGLKEMGISRQDSMPPQ